MEEMAIANEPAVRATADVVAMPKAEQVGYLRGKFDALYYRHRARGGDDGSHAGHSNMAKILETLSLDTAAGAARAELRDALLKESAVVAADVMSDADDSPDDQQQRRQKRAVAAGSPVAAAVPTYVPLHAVRSVARAPKGASREKLREAALQARRRFARVGSAPPQEVAKLDGFTAADSVAALQGQVGLLQNQVLGLSHTPEMQALRQKVRDLETRVDRQQAALKGFSQRAAASNAQLPHKFAFPQVHRRATGNDPPRGSKLALVCVMAAGMNEVMAACADVKRRRLFQELLRTLHALSEDYSCSAVTARDEASVWAFENAERALQWCMACHEQLARTAAEPGAVRWRELATLKMGVHTGSVEQKRNPLTGVTWYHGAVLKTAMALAIGCVGGCVAVSSEVHASVRGRAAPFTSHGFDDGYLLAPAGARVEARLPERRTLKLADNVDAAIKGFVAAREPAGMPTDWQPPQAYPYLWPPEGTVTAVACVVDRYHELEASAQSDAEAALDLCFSELRRQLKEHCGYESREEGPLFLAIFQEPADALAWALQVQQALNYREWPEAVLRHPAANCLMVGASVVLRGPRVAMGMHTCDAESLPDAVTGRHFYFGPEMALAAAATTVGVGGEIVASAHTVRLLREAAVEASAKLGYPAMTPIRPVVMPGEAEPFACFEVSNNALSQRRSFVGRGFARSTTKDQSNDVGELERRVRQLEADLQRKAEEASELALRCHEAEAVAQAHAADAADSAGAPPPQPSDSASGKGTSLNVKRFNEALRGVYDYHAPRLRRQNTFVLVDVEGSSELAQDAADAYDEGLGAARDCMAANLLRHRGRCLTSARDASLFLFAYPQAAVLWCVAVQVDCFRLPWPAALHAAEPSKQDVGAHWSGLRLRMGVHTSCDAVGTIDAPDCRRRILTGPPVKVTALVHQRAIGGEILCTRAVAAAAETEGSGFSMEPFGAVQTEPRATQQGEAPPSVELLRVCPDALGGRAKVLARESDATSRRAAPGHRFDGSSQPTCAAVRVSQMAEIRQALPAAQRRRVLAQVTQLLERTLQDAGGYPAQRLLDVCADAESDAVALCMFPSPSQAAQWAMRLQAEAMWLDVGPVAEAAPCFAAVSDDGGQLFRGVRLAVGLYPTPDAELRRDHSPLAAGVVCVSKNLAVACLLCRAARGGEILTPQKVVASLSRGVPEYIASPITDLDYGGGTFEDVCQIFPSNLAGRAWHLKASERACALTAPDYSHRQLRAADDAASRRAADARDRHFVRMATTKAAPTAAAAALRRTHAQLAAAEGAAHAHALQRRHAPTAPAPPAPLQPAELRLLAACEAATMLAHDTCFHEQTLGGGANAVGADQLLSLVEPPSRATPQLSPSGHGNAASDAGDVDSAEVEESPRAGQMRALEAEAKEGRAAARELRAAHEAVRTFAQLVASLAAAGTLAATPDDDFAQRWLQKARKGHGKTRRLLDGAAALQAEPPSADAKKAAASVSAHCMQLYSKIRAAAASGCLRRRSSSNALAKCASIEESRGGGGAGGDGGVSGRSSSSSRLSRLPSLKLAKTVSRKVSV